MASIRHYSFAKYWVHCCRKFGKGYFQISSMRLMLLFSWCVCVWFALAVLPAALSDGDRDPIIRGTAVVLDTKLDFRADYLKPTYIQGQDFIYIFDRRFAGDSIYQFDIRGHEITTVGLQNFTAGSVVSTGGSEILYFGGQREGYRAEIMMWNSSYPSNPMEVIGTLPNPTSYSSAVWNTAMGEAYVLGGRQEFGFQYLDTIVKFQVGIPDATIIATMVPRAYTSAVWDDNTNVAYVFGGGAPEGVSAEIIKFDPAVGDAIVLDELLPAALLYSCAVWTGQEALIIGENPPSASGNERVTSRNIASFVPGNGEEPDKVTQIEVDNFPSIESPGCAYVKATDRIYIFGGRIANQISDQIMYIQLRRDNNPSTTEGSATTLGPDPTTTEGVEPTTQSTTTVFTTTTTEKMTSTTVPTTTTSTTTTTETIPSTVDPTNPEVCDAIDKYGTRFQATAGNTARASCPGFESTGIATWFCTALGEFDGPQPNYRNCTNGWLAGVEGGLPPEGTPIDYETAARLLETFQKYVTWAATYGNVTYFGHEIKALFEIGQRILEMSALDTDTLLEQREELTTTNMDVYSILLAFVSPWEELTEGEIAQTATVFISSTDVSSITLASAVPLPNDEAPGYRKPFDTNPEFDVLAGTEVASNSSQNRITFPYEYNLKKDSYIEVPATWADGFVPGAIVPFSGVHLVSTRANFLFRPPVPEGIAGTILNGPLMSFTFGEGYEPRRGVAHKQNFSDDSGVQISFQHAVRAWGDEPTQIRRKLHSDQGERPKAVQGSAICAFWDPVGFKWSGLGCKLVSSERDTTVCECNHLTSFAVIMDLHDYIGQDKALTIITFILSPLSTLGLLLYILLFISHRRKQRLMSNHPRNELTFGLCVSLFVANLLILVTMDKNYLYLSDEMCIASGIALHYALLCAFAWMALEGILLARLVLIDVFSSGREHKKIERVAAFAVPAAIVGITCAVNFSRGDHGYGNDAFCWLNGGYLWSFIAPMIVVVLFNAVVLSLSIRRSHLLKTQSNLKVQRKASSIGIWLQGSLSLTALMGITWAFGFLMLFNHSEVAHVSAYIFTLFNASQGIFIFAFHVAANEQIQRKFSIFTTKSTTAPASVAEVKGSELRDKSGKDSNLSK